MTVLWASCTLCGMQSCLFSYPFWIVESEFGLVLELALGFEWRGEQVQHLCGKLSLGSNACATWWQWVNALTLPLFSDTQGNAASTCLHFADCP